MPSKSKAQAGMMGVLYRKGKITRKQLRDYNEGIDYSKLPEHVRKRKGKHEGKHKRRKADNVQIMRAAISRLHK